MAAETETLNGRTNGRPSIKSDSRTFKLFPDVDDFLDKEKTRTHRDLTAIVEVSVRHFKRLPADKRDQLYLVHCGKVDEEVGE